MTDTSKEAVERAICRPVIHMVNTGASPSLDGCGTMIDVARALVSERDALSARVAELEADRLAADNALVDMYRNPTTGRFKFPDDVAAIVRRLDKAEAAQGQMVASVKPLEWECEAGWRWKGRPSEEFFTSVCKWVWQVPSGDFCCAGHKEKFDTLEEAKAAAQAAFEKRILSAIALTPHAEAKREGMLEAAEVAQHRHSKWTNRSGVECDVTACAEIADAIRAKAEKSE